MEPRTIPQGYPTWYTLTIKGIKDVGFPVVASIGLFYLAIFGIESLKDMIVKVQADNSSIIDYEIKSMKIHEQMLYFMQVDCLRKSKDSSERSECYYKS